MGDVVAFTRDPDNSEAFNRAAAFALNCPHGHPATTATAPCCAVLRRILRNSQGTDLFVQHAREARDEALRNWPRPSLGVVDGG